MSTVRTRALDLKRLRDAVAGPAAAIRLKMELQPAGGAGDKVFPPTYVGGVYAWEDRTLVRHADPIRTCLLDSVQSQANRLELALLESHRRGDLRFPILEVDFSDS